MVPLPSIAAIDQSIGMYTKLMKEIGRKRKALNQQRSALLLEESLFRQLVQPTPTLEYGVLEVFRIVLKTWVEWERSMVLQEEQLEEGLAEQLALLKLYLEEQKNLQRQLKLVVEKSQKRLGKVERAEAKIVSHQKKVFQALGKLQTAYAGTDQGDRIYELEKEMRPLQDELGQNSLTLSGIRRRLVALHSGIQEAEAQISKLNEGITENQRVMLRHQRDIQHNEELVEQLDEGKLRGFVEQLKTQIRETESEMGRISRKLNKLNAEYKVKPTRKSKAEIKRLTREKDTLKKALSDLKQKQTYAHKSLEQIATLKQENDRLAKANDVLDKAISENLTEIEKLQESRHALQADVTQLGDEQQATLEQMTRLLRQVAPLQRELARLYQRLHEGQRRQVGIHGDLTDHKRRIHQEQLNINTYQAELVELHVRENNLQKELSANRKGIIDVETKINLMEVSRTEWAPVRKKQDTIRQMSVAFQDNELIEDLNHVLNCIQLPVNDHLAGAERVRGYVRLFEPEANNGLRTASGFQIHDLQVSIRGFYDVLHQQFRYCYEMVQSESSRSTFRLVNADEHDVLKGRLAQALAGFQEQLRSAREVYREAQHHLVAKLDEAKQELYASDLLTEKHATLPILFDQVTVWRWNQLIGFRRKVHLSRTFGEDFEIDIRFSQEDDLESHEPVAAYLSESVWLFTTALLQDPHTAHAAIDHLASGMAQRYPVQPIKIGLTRLAIHQKYEPDPEEVYDRYLRDKEATLLCLRHLSDDFFEVGAVLQSVLEAAYEVLLRSSHEWSIDQFLLDYRADEPGGNPFRLYRNGHDLTVNGTQVKALLSDVRQRLLQQVLSVLEDLDQYIRQEFDVPHLLSPDLEAIGTVREAMNAYQALEGIYLDAWAEQFLRHHSSRDLWLDQNTDGHVSA